jgi:hypothetical protein
MTAVGASPRDIVRLIAGRGLATVSAGLAAGVADALATTGLQGSLYNVSATDPVTFLSRRRCSVSPSSPTSSLQPSRDAGAAAA